MPHTHEVITPAISLKITFGQNLCLNCPGQVSPNGQVGFEKMNQWHYFSPPFLWKKNANCKTQNHNHFFSDIQLVWPVTGTK